MFPLTFREKSRRSDGPRHGKDADLGRIPSQTNERVSPLLHAESARPTPTEELEET
jgi:hypothetical protein